MANEVTIIVTSKDKTRFKPIGEKARTEIAQGVEGGLDDAEKATEERAPKIGDEAGSAIGKRTRTSMRQPIEEGLEETKKTFKDRFYEIGDYSGRTLTEKLDEHLKTWDEHLTETVDVKVKTKFREVGEHGGRSMNQGLEGALKAVEKLGNSAGKDLDNSFGKSLGGAVSTVTSAWIPILIAALIPEMPAIGALAASALVLAFGAGLAGLGLAASFHLKSVQKEFTQFKKFASAWAKDIGQPFKETWATIFGTAGNVLKKFQPVLKGAFKDFVAPAVTNFVLRLGEAFTKLAPAIRPVSEAFSKLMGSIGDQLPGIFDGIAKSLTSMSKTISDNPDLFAGFITGLLKIVVYGLRVIDFLSKLFDKFSRFEHTKNPFTLMLAALSPLLAILLHLGKAGDVFHTLGDAAQSVGKHLGTLFDKIKTSAAPILKEISGQIKNELVPAFERFVRAATPFANKLIDLFSPQVVQGIENVLHIVSGLIDLISGGLNIASGIMSGDLGKISDGVAQQFRGAEKIVKTAMRSILDTLTLGHGDKVLKITLSAVDKVKGPVQSAARTATSFAKRLFRANLTAVSKVSGPVKSAISAGVGFARRSYRANLTAVSKVSGPVKSAISNCVGFARRAFRANLTAVNRVASALAAAIRLGNQWASRVFTATFNVRRIISNLNPFKATGGIVGGLATGGIVRGQAGGGPGGSLTWVGEQGAELVRLPTGSQVYPHGQSMGMAARAGGGDVMKLEVEWVGGNAPGPFFEWIRENIRIKGGLQKALG